MRAPEFCEPTTVAEACALLAEEPLDSTVIAGGTAVVLMMKNRLISPGRLVNIAGIPDLHEIRRTAQAVQIGAAATLAQVAASPDVRDVAPSLAHACSDVGNARVRNVATLGGNVGEADYASDPPAVLASLGARCEISGPTESRVAELGELITGYYETAISATEVVTRIDIPIATRPRHSVYLKYRSRSSEDRACVGVAATLELSAERVAGLDVHVSAVASTPQSLPDVTAAAVGQPMSAELARGIAASYAERIDAIGDARGSERYRRKMVEVYVRRALEELERRCNSTWNGT